MFQLLMVGYGSVWHLFTGYNVKVKHEPLAGVIGTFEGEDKAPRLKMTNKKWFMAADAQDISTKPFFIEI